MSVRPPEGMRVEPLARADIPMALRLVQECGWNQVGADWSLFIEHGTAWQVRSADGSIAATAATLPYPPHFGWISMVLVGGAHRRQGLATALLARCVAQLQGRGLVPVLDATPAGREVYRQLGFADGWPITRWRRTAAAPPGATLPLVPQVRALRDEDWAQVAALDAIAAGADRTWLLRALAARAADLACVFERDGRVQGYLLARDGRLATQLGPIVAREPQEADALLAHALQRARGPLLVDALDGHAGFAQRLGAAGFQVERGYTRMALGAAQPFGDDARVFAIAGPELG